MTSYGGNLSHVISFVASPDGKPISAPDVILAVRILNEYKSFKINTNTHAVICSMPKRVVLLHYNKECRHCISGIRNGYKSHVSLKLEEKSSFGKAEHKI